jgi:glutaredoxin
MTLVRSTRWSAWLCIFAATTAQAADTVYKAVGPDGRVIYTDRPPAEAKVQKTMRMEQLPASPLPASVLRYQEELKKRGAQSAALPADDAVPVLLSAQWCGYCRQAKQYLNAKKIAYRELDIEQEPGQRKLAELGGKGVPVLAWRGRKLEGFSQPAYERFFTGS